MSESINDRIKRLAAEKTRKTEPSIESGTEITVLSTGGDSSKLDTYRPIVSPTLANQFKSDGFGTLPLKIQSWRARMSAEKLRQDTALTMLQDQADAAKRESVAFWTTKSAEIAETMMTYLAEHLENMEATRMANTISALEKASHIIDLKLKEIDQKDLTETVKDKLMELSFAQYEIACDRIKKDTLMEKYKTNK